MQIDACNQTVRMEEKKKGGISGSSVKIIAVIAMLIDHAAAVVLTRILMSGGMAEIMTGENEQEMARWVMDNATLYLAYLAMRMIGRLGFPIFCFLLVEGYQRTRNVGKYAFRLGVFALISEVPFDLAVTGSVFEIGYQNVFFTLLLGLAALWIYDLVDKWTKKELPAAGKGLFAVTAVLLSASYAALFMRNSYHLTDETLLYILFGVFASGAAAGFALYGRKRGTLCFQRAVVDATVLVLIMYLADLLKTDYSGMGVLTITAMYLFRRNKVLSMTAGCVVLVAMSVSEITAFAALIPVALYNGRRGLKMKYFFYVFYPVHLLLLYLVSVALGLGKVILF